jgi:hypothetical protein
MRIEPDLMESRLDAMGRALVEEEARRAEPPRAYLEAAANRAWFARVRVWGPRLAVAAVLVIVGIAAMMLSRPAATAGGGGPVIAHGDGVGEGPGGEAPTMGNLNAANRNASPEQLRLLNGAAGAQAAGSGAGGESGPYRASDTRSAEQIDAIVGGK